jgi:heptosyltransferase I
MTILVIRLGALGDVLRTLPAVRLLRRAWPQARIHWAVDDRFALALAGHPDLDGLVVFPRRRFGPRVGAAFLRELRGIRAEIAVDFHGHLRSGLVALFSGASRRIGPAGAQQKEGNRWLTTEHVDCGPRRTARVERNLALVRDLGVRPEAALPVGDLPLAAAGRPAASTLLTEHVGAGRPYAVISPGASTAQAYKKPPAALLSAAAAALSARGIAPLVVWGPGEEPDARRVVERRESPSILAPPTDLRTLAGLIAGARLFVGGDSGPLHLACATGCPVVGIYGPTDPLINRPWGVPYRAVAPEEREYTGIKRIDRRGGFAGLDPDQVAQAVIELIAS